MSLGGGKVARGFRGEDGHCIVVCPDLESTILQNRHFLLNVYVKEQSSLTFIY